MRIAILQFAPQVGDIDNNLNRADAVLSKANPKDLDLLVLPEMAFSGYNFKSLQHIIPYLEPTTSGITSLWARTTALKHDCVVTVGYPEKATVGPNWPAVPEYYNSAITVNRDGETVANYRKSFLYYTDERWALEGLDGFFGGQIPGLGNVAMGICMDLNPYKFEAPWSAWEFAYHILHKQANLVILSMAWLTVEDASSYSSVPKEPDMETLSYWLSRLEPVIRVENVGEIIVVLANRCGVEGDAIYAGTSCVLGINEGEVNVYGILGRCERKLLVVDTEKKPKAKLVSEPNSAASRTTNTTNETQESMDTQPTTPDRDKFRSSIDSILAANAPIMSPHSTSHTDSLPFSTNDISKSPKVVKGSNGDDLSPSQSTPPDIERLASPKPVNSSRNSSQKRSPQTRSRSTSKVRQENTTTGYPFDQSELDLFSAQVPFAEDDSTASSKIFQPTLSIEIPKNPTSSTLGTDGGCHSPLSPKSFARPASRDTNGLRMHSGVSPESPQSIKLRDDGHPIRQASRNPSKVRAGLLPESPESMTQPDEEKPAPTASRNNSPMGTTPLEVITLSDSLDSSMRGRKGRVTRPITRESDQRIPRKPETQQPSRLRGSPTPKPSRPTNIDFDPEVDTTVIVYMNASDNFEGNVVPYSTSYIQTAPHFTGERRGRLGPLPRAIVRRRHSLLW